MYCVIFFFSFAWLMANKNRKNGKSWTSTNTLQCTRKRKLFSPQKINNKQTKRQADNDLLLFICFLAVWWSWSDWKTSRNETFVPFICEYSFVSSIIIIFCVTELRIRKFPTLSCIFLPFLSYFAVVSLFRRYSAGTSPWGHPGKDSVSISCD